MKTILDSLKNRRILITCGTGGVGKTTVAASLAVQAALLGKKAVVITIDPAKRLATSLGLKTLSTEPTDLTASLETAVGKACTGKLYALMPESSQSFDRLIRSLTHKPEVLEKIFNNPILKTFSQELSGANEYLALEELHHLFLQKQFDLIILDTPPSRNTVSFLEAPRLLSRFFEEKLIKWLVLPANKIVAGGVRKLFSILEKLTGAGFMNSLFDFGEALFAIQENFLAKLKKINALLQSEDVAFLMVTGPHPENAEELGHFLGQISAQGFHFDGVIVNRSLAHLKDSTTPDSAQAGVKILKSLKDREDLALTKLQSASLRFTHNNELFFLRLPELSRDVHSIEDLYYVAQTLV
jgi:anion-transporting  ArsA/GET3 family ATPase